MSWVDDVNEETYRTILFFFGVYDTHVILSEKQYLLSGICLLATFISAGISRLFFRIVPVIIKL